MSKKNVFAKFILFCLAVGAAAAGVFYYLTKREEEIADSFDDDDFDDFDDFDDDDEISSDSKFGTRKYVDITSASNDSDETKEDDSEEDLNEEDLDEEDAPEESEEFFDDEDK